MPHHITLTNCIKWNAPHRFLHIVHITKTQHAQGYNFAETAIRGVNGKHWVLPAITLVFIKPEQILWNRNRFQSNRPRCDGRRCTGLLLLWIWSVTSSWGQWISDGKGHFNAVGDEMGKNYTGAWLLRPFSLVQQNFTWQSSLHSHAEVHVNK